MVRRARMIPLFLLFALAPQVSAQEGEVLSLEKYLDWEWVADPRISPDGSRIVYTRSWVDQQDDRRASSVWVMNADGSRARFLLEGSSPRWSPDGTRIAFLNDSQIFVRWMDAEGATTQITRLEESPSDIAWSPDGTHISFVMTVPSDESWPIDMPSPPEGASWTEAPKIVTRLTYRRDRRGYIDDGFQHLFLVPAEGGTPRQLTDGDWNHSAPQWMPDGSEIVFQSLRIEDSEDIDQTWRESEIYAVNVRSREIRQITDHRGPDGSPVPSPDGRLIAYQANDWSDDTYVETGLYVMNADGSGSRRIGSELGRRLSGVTWARDGSGVYFTAAMTGNSNLWFAPVIGEPRAVTSGNHMLAVTTVDERGQAVGTLTSYHEAGDVISFGLDSPGDIRQLTRVNDDILADVRLGEVEEIWYKSVDDFDIQGWVIKPPDFDPSERYPLILAIHGGPHGMYNVGFNFGWQNHAANGYVVLYTNPRAQLGLRQPLRQRDQERLSGQGLQRPDERSRRGDRPGLRRHRQHVRLWLLRGRRADLMGRRPHRPLPRGVRQLSGHQLAVVRRHDRRSHLVQELRALPLGRPLGAPAPLAADVRGQRDHAHHAHDRRDGPPHADGADRGVLPGAAGPEGPGGHGALQGRMARHLEHPLQLPAHPALPAQLVREVDDADAGYGGRRPLKPTPVRRQRSPGMVPGAPFSCWCVDQDPLRDRGDHPAAAVRSRRDRVAGPRVSLLSSLSLAVGRVSRLLERV